MSSKGRKPTPEEIAEGRRWMQQEHERAKQWRAQQEERYGKPGQRASHIGEGDVDTTPMVPLDQEVQAIWERIQKLKMAGPKKKAPPGFYKQERKPPTCPTCRDTRVQPEAVEIRDGAHIRITHPPCPDCAPQHLQKRLDEAWPLPDRLADEGHQKLMALRGEVGSLLFRVLRGVTTWPEQGAFVVLAGVKAPAYGSGKSHALARLWQMAHEDGVPVVYTTAPELQKRLTSFDTHDPDGNELPGAVTYRQHLADLAAARVLLIDEATRATSGGWVETQIAFQVIDRALQERRIVVLATNSFNDLHPALQDRAHDRAHGAIIVDLSDIPSFRRRDDQPDTPDWVPEG